jgi:hypothetical protein
MKYLKKYEYFIDNEATRLYDILGYLNDGDVIIDKNINDEPYDTITTYNF